MFASYSGLNAYRSQPVLGLGKIVSYEPKSGVVIPFPRSARMSAPSRQRARTDASLIHVRKWSVPDQAADHARADRGLTDAVIAIAVMAALAAAHVTFVLSVLGVRVF